MSLAESTGPAGAPGDASTGGGALEATGSAASRALASSSQDATQGRTLAHNRPPMENRTLPCSGSKLAASGKNFSAVALRSKAPSAMWISVQEV